MLLLSKKVFIKGKLTGSSSKTHENKIVPLRSSGLHRQLLLKLSANKARMAGTLETSQSQIKRFRHKAQLK
jgi:hypothetical protein